MIKFPKKNKNTLQRNKDNAESIGMRYAALSVTIGVIIAYFIPVFLFFDETLSSFLWIFKGGFSYNYLLGIILFYVMGIYFGKKAGTEIILFHKKPVYTGVKYGVLTLISTITFTGIFLFFLEGLSNIVGFSNGYYDYIFQVVYLVLSYGILPSILVGIYFGLQIKKQTKLIIND